MVATAGHPGTSSNQAFYIAHGSIFVPRNIMPQNTSGKAIMIRCLRLRRTFKSVSIQPYFPVMALRHIGKERTSRVAATRGLPYQANGLLYPPGGLLMLPPLEDCQCLAVGHTATDKL